MLSQATGLQMQLFPSITGQQQQQQANKKTLNKVENEIRGLIRTISESAAAALRHNRLLTTPTRWRKTSAGVSFGPPSLHFVSMATGGGSQRGLKQTPRSRAPPSIERPRTPREILQAYPGRKKNVSWHSLECVEGAGGLLKVFSCAHRHGSLLNFDFWIFAKKTGEFIAICDDVEIKLKGSWEDETMAMQEHLRIKEHHRCSITALGYHSARRECLTGFEDGVIKWWDMGSGHMTLCSKEHAGWITHFLSWIQARLLFSASNDSSVLVWAPGGTVLDRILLGYPIFTLAISLTRHLLLCGSKGRLTVFPLDEKRESGHTVNITQSFSEWTHKDIVSCITCLDNHIYTAGYDKKLLIFDTYQTQGRKGLTKKQCISRAHNAAITHLILVRQQETTRVLSGSFDQTVGIWSQDGKLIQRLGPFSSNISGLCYVAPIGVIWITSGTSQPTLYEPQSGEIVSQFISTFQDNQKDELVLQQLLSLPDSRHVIGLAKPQQVVIWRYSELGCLTLLPCKHSLECLAYAKKEPVLLFSGDSNGMLQKWERSYRSPFIYSRESFHIDETHLERRGPLADQIEKGHQKESEPCPESVQKWRACSRLRSCYSRSQITSKGTGKEKIEFTRVIFVEQLDILVMSATNGNIYLWEFVTFIPSAQPIVQQNMSALDQDSKTLGKDCAQDKMVCDPSSSCISDLICRIVLCGHTSMITALALVTNENGIHAPYLLSGGWDGRLCLWNLQKRSFQNAFSNLPGDNGPILDVACSQNSQHPPAHERREFAFSTSTGVFICAFNFHCADLELMAELCGHKITVLALAWHPQQNKWVTGAEDGTIQLWSKDGCCVRNMKAPRGITCICIDQINGCIMAGEHDTIRIYDPNSGALVQSYTGHQDSIKGLIHVPEMKQYVSVSLDGTARIWKAYHQGG